MKEIFLIRHAHTPAGTPDELRILSPLGVEQAKHIGIRLFGNTTRPQLIVCSPAVRTRQTAELLAVACGLDSMTIHFEKKLYESTLDDYLEVVSAFDEKVESAWLVGHNWAISALAQYMSGDSRFEMQPCTIVRMVFEESEWHKIRSAKCLELEFFIPPDRAYF
ncbi:MAG: SixA phosphatase family protein [Bacteroidota bacterium]